jgi:hypothetical protein
MIYKIKHTLDSSLVGKVPQIEEITGTYHVDADYSFRKVPKSGPIQYDIKFPTLKLAWRAKAIDWLSVGLLDSSKFMVVSPKLNEAIFTEGFNIDETQVFTTEAQTARGKTFLYYVIYFINDRISEFLNWKESKFIVSDNNFHYDDHKTLLFTEIRELNIDSKETYISAIRKGDLGGAIRLKKTVINDELEFDFFKCTSPIQGYFCSEKFKNHLEESELVGIEFEPVELVKEIKTKVSS